MDIGDWPEVPQELRPKPLYVREQLASNEKEVLEKRGWNLIDVRILPARTDGERAEAVKATLEGIRQGSITNITDASIVRFLELETKIYGMTNNKDGPGKQFVEQKANDSLDTLLDFGKIDADTFVDVKRPKGRPKKVKVDD
jgi:hypothetical protein